jgi:tRNA threonylcarbamoyladenosine biosynthesis protein TsaB
MRVLAIECSDRGGSVAALDGGRTVAEQSLPADRRSAQSLAPAIDELLRSLGWSAGNVQLVAVTQGPGSFTGLRVGVTTAKALAFSVGCPIIGVNTLEVIAYQSPEEVGDVNVVLPAERKELFAGRLARTAEGSWWWIDETRIVSQQAWLESLATGQRVSGPGLRLVAERLPPGVRPLDEPCWDPRAATVGWLGWQRYQAGEREDVFQLVPHYFRRTAAEEQWERRGKTI